MYRVNVSVDFAINPLEPWGHPALTPVKAGSKEWQSPLPDRQFVEVPAQSRLFAAQEAQRVRDCLEQRGEVLQKRDHEHAPSLEEGDGQ